jgi:hypothetical protein
LQSNETAPAAKVDTLMLSPIFSQLPVTEIFFGLKLKLQCQLSNASIHGRATDDAERG